MILGSPDLGAEDILKLTKIRKELKQKHSWVEKLYELAQAIEKDRKWAWECYQNEKKEHSQDIDQKDEEIEELRGQVLEFSRKVKGLEKTLNENPPELRLNSTHMLVDHNHWKLKKDELERLEGRLKAATVAAVSGWIVVVSTIIFALVR